VTHDAMRRANPPPVDAPMHRISRRPLATIESFSPSGGMRNHHPTTYKSGRFVTSGRAAIFWALQRLGISSGDSVLVPTYHCPTLVAPLVALGARPAFYPLQYPGTPNADWLAQVDSNGVRAIIIVQLFGLPQCLASLRAWCDERGIPMIEDCAHSLFGKAGDRRSGEWGDYATFSLTKFLPVGELGFVASTRHGLPKLRLDRSSLRSQVRGALDPLEASADADRFGAIGVRMAAFGRWIRARRGPASTPRSEPPATQSAVLRALRDCDMARIRAKPALAALAIERLSDYSAIASRRRANFQRMAELLDRYPIGRPLLRSAPDDAGPYVFPLLVDRPDVVYSAMRAIAFPVYRWDRLWPGTPIDESDLTSTWRNHLLQIPVHQSYTDEEFRALASMLEQISRH
jgi:perosamine synthetase